MCWVHERGLARASAESVDRSWMSIVYTVEYTVVD